VSPSRIGPLLYLPWKNEAWPPHSSRVSTQHNPYFLECCAPPSRTFSSVPHNALPSFRFTSDPCAAFSWRTLTNAPRVFSQRDWGGCLRIFPFPLTREFLLGIRRSVTFLGEHPRTNCVRSSPPEPPLFPSFPLVPPFVNLIHFVTYFSVICQIYSLL